MDINNLTAFIEVAKQQSFSKAAEILFLTQPAISKRITALETELGTALFNRINRKVTLTEAGRALLPRAQNLRYELEDIRRIASQLSEQVAGSLSMGTSHHIGLHRLPPFLSFFNTTYPDVHLDLHFVGSEQACEAVEQGDLELAFITLPSELPPQLHAKALWQDELHIVVNREHKLAQFAEVSLEALQAERCILPGKDTYTYQLIAQAFQALTHKLNIYLTTHYLDTLKMLVSAGFGWSVLPHTLVDKTMVVLNTPVKLTRQLGVITHRRRSLSNAASTLLTHLDRFSDGKA
ncbi:MAG: LysR family transcriptional regulator [Thiotrichaceae bacterium]|uniref:LysR family transcriptional regulator n=1 Tax=Candidatus Thiocaldithrix dubininis TaxID=3080823 RepID=A0AA95KG98_9GAMM|nr:MAG: LysR family transcriptional regulator [Candidatus Thiocaldithrix dubininis]